MTRHPRHPGTLTSSVLVVQDQSLQTVLVVSQHGELFLNLVCDYIEILPEAYTTCQDLVASTLHWLLICISFVEKKGTK